MAWHLHKHRGSFTFTFTLPYRTLPYFTLHYLTLPLPLPYLTLPYIPSFRSSVFLHFFVHMGVFSSHIWPKITVY